MKPPEEFVQIIAEAVERCTDQALASGLNGRALHAYAAIRFVGIFWPYWPLVRHWILEESCVGTGMVVDGDVEGMIADEILERVEARRLS
jgi:hypothetical protein